MGNRRIDDIARLLSTRRGILGLLGVSLGGVSLVNADATEAKKGHPRKRKHRKKQKERKSRQQKRQYPVFTTCHTATEELGPIPDGPHPTCQSPYDPDEFTPCNRSLTFNDLKQTCDEAYSACNGDCRIKADPISGLGDCADFWTCASPTMETTPPLPGAPYGSCWSGPDWRCETCPGAKVGYQGLKDLCGTTYPRGAHLSCWDKLGRNDCFPAGSG